MMRFASLFGVLQSSALKTAIVKKKKDVKTRVCAYIGFTSKESKGETLYNKSQY